MELINLSEATRILGMGKRTQQVTLAKIGIKPVYTDGPHGPVLYEKSIIMAAAEKLQAERLPLTLEDRVKRLEDALNRFMEVKS